MRNKSLYLYAISLFFVFFALLFTSYKKVDDRVKVGFIIDNFDIDRWYKDTEFFIEGEVLQMVQFWRLETTTGLMTL